jgi:hypothetical protein
MFCVTLSTLHVFKDIWMLLIMLLIVAAASASLLVQVAPPAVAFEQPLRCW